MNDNLTTNASNEAESPAFLVGAVSGSFMCAHGNENRCKVQCYTCSEDEKCDMKYSYKHGLMDTWKFAEWIAEHVG